MVRRALFHAVWFAALAAGIGWFYPGSFHIGGLVGPLLMSMGLALAIALPSVLLGPVPRGLFTLMAFALWVAIVIPGSARAYRDYAGQVAENLRTERGAEGSDVELFERYAQGMLDDDEARGFGAYLRVRALEGHVPPAVGRTGSFQRTGGLMWLGFWAHWVFLLVATVGTAWSLGEEGEWAADGSYRRAGKGRRAGPGTGPLGAAGPELGTDDAEGGPGARYRLSPGGRHGYDRSWTPLQVFAAAIYNRDVPMLDEMLDEGVSVDARHPSGNPLVLEAALAGAPEVVAWFLDHDVELEMRSPTGASLLHHCAASDDLAVLIPRILAAGTEVDDRAEWGVTPLMWAAQKLCEPAMEALLAAGADPLATEHNGDTVAHHLLRGMPHDQPDRHHARRIHWLGRLLDAGVDPNARGRYEETLIKVATFCGQTPVVVFLAERGADPNIPDGEGVTPLLQAALSSASGLVKVLESAGAAADFPAQVALGRVEPVMEQLSARPALASEVHPGLGTGPLGLAIHAGQAEMVDRLLRAGADPRGPGYHLPLVHQAVGAVIRRELPAETLVRLLEAGADVNEPDADGFTPLHRAVQADDARLAGLLLRSGARPNVRDERGEAPLDAATSNEMRTLLESFGARA